MSVIVGIGEQLLERPEAEQFVDQHLFQRELLAAVERDLELGEHLADDRAEFLGQLVLVERRGGFGVDALEQAREHLLLDLVDRGFEAFGLAVAGFARRFWRPAAASIASLMPPAAREPPASGCGVVRVLARVPRAAEIGRRRWKPRWLDHLHWLGDAEASCRPPPCRFACPNALMPVVSPAN